MTLSEILHSLEKPSLPEICQCVLYFRETFEGAKSSTVADIKASLRLAGYRKQAASNISRALDQSGPRVHISGSKGRANLWSLTSPGKKAIASRIPAIKAGEKINEAGSLHSLASRLDEDSAAYVDEAIRCLEADALHASVLFLWSAAVRSIQREVIKHPKQRLDAAVSKYAPKAPTVRKIDHLSYVQESSLLLIAETIGIFDRNERSELEKCLDLRNRCGHPGKYKPGPKKVASFIEDISSIVFNADSK